MTWSDDAERRGVHSHAERGNEIQILFCLRVVTNSTVLGLRGDSLVVGALPMANVLVAGLLIARQRPRSRPFLLGFEVFSAIALALYVVLW